MRPRAYAWQVKGLDSTAGIDLVRTEDGSVVGSSRDLDALVRELERLALENQKLREGRDEKLRRQCQEIDQLRTQLALKAAEAKGQGVLC